MKTKIILGLVLTLGLLVSGIEAANAVITIDASDTVAASATVGGVQTLTVATKKVSDNTATSPVKTIAFGSISGSVSNAPAYIEVAYACNQSLWKVDLYTNNTGADTTVLKYQRAGLLKSDGKDRVPLYWCVFDATATAPTLTLDANGVPVTRTPTKYPVGGTTATNIVTDWAVMKDKNDLDDPNSTTINESWTTAFSGGYCDLMYGAPGYSNLSAFPYYDLAVSGSTGQWLPTDTTYPPTTNTIHRAATTPAVVYIAAGGGFASAGSYSANIGLDLYHE